MVLYFLLSESKLPYSLLKFRYYILQALQTNTLVATYAPSKALYRDAVGCLHAHEKIYDIPVNLLLFTAF